MTLQTNVENVEMMIMMMIKTSATAECPKIKPGSPTLRSDSLLSGDRRELVKIFKNQYWGRGPGVPVGQA